MVFSPATSCRSVSTENKPCFRLQPRSTGHEGQRSSAQNIACRVFGISNDNKLSLLRLHANRILGAVEPFPHCTTSSGAPSVGDGRKLCMTPRRMDSTIDNGGRGCRRLACGTRQPRWRVFMNEVAMRRFRHTYLGVIEDGIGRPRASPHVLPSAEHAKLWRRRASSWTAHCYSRTAEDATVAFVMRRVDGERGVCSTEVLSCLIEPGVRHVAGVPASSRQRVQ